MVFTLEALPALHGDCLLVHYGDAGAPRTVLVDGGPGVVYGRALKPRLLGLGRALIAAGRIADADALPLALIIVSHMDDDHIGGLLGLASDPDGGLGLQRTHWVAPTALWHNTFEDVVGDPAPVGDLALDPHEDGKTRAVIASVNQARELQVRAEALGWRINHPLPSIVQAPDSGGRVVDMGDGLTLTVIGPRQGEIARMQRKWNREIERLRRGQTRSARIAAYVDNSPENISSIVCVARTASASMLLTGDARGDHVLDSLDAAGLTNARGAVHFDILKVPHHGSIRDLDHDFFERVTADHYVISASGRYGNPETETLRMIAAARDRDSFTIHLTYTACEQDLQQRLQAFQAERDAAGRRFGIAARRDGDRSIQIDLADVPAI